MFFSERVTLRFHAAGLSVRCHKDVKNRFSTPTLVSACASLEGMRLFLALFVLCVPGGFAAVTPYVGAIGGIATLSADAGSQSTAQGLTLSSYGPKNGGALNIFAGAHLHDYFSVQADYIWNRN